MGNEDKKDNYNENKNIKKEDIGSTRHAEEQDVKKNQSTTPKSPDSHSRQDKPL